MTYIHKLISKAESFASGPSCRKIEPHERINSQPSINLESSTIVTEVEYNYLIEVHGDTEGQRYEHQDSRLKVNQPLDKPILDHGSVSRHPKKLSGDPLQPKHIPRSDWKILCFLW